MACLTQGRLSTFKILTEINVSDGLYSRIKLRFICTQASKRQRFIVVKLQIKPLLSFHLRFQTLICIKLIKQYQQNKSKDARLAPFCNFTRLIICL